MNNSFKHLVFANILILSFLLSQLNAEYEAVNAFPNLSFNDPVGIYHAGDGTNRLFVLEQPGTIKVFNNDPTTVNVQTFLNITSIQAFLSGLKNLALLESGVTLVAFAIIFHIYRYGKKTIATPQKTVTS